MFSAFVGTLILLLPLFSYATDCEKDVLPFAENAQPTLISDQLLFIEGPTWSASQSAFFFSEMDFSKPQDHGPHATIYKLSLPSTISTFIESSGSNGLLATEEGLLAMTHGSQSLSRFDWQTGENTIIADSINSKRFNSPNDLVQHTNGNIYFTDPDWQLGPRESQTGVTGVYMFNPATAEVILIDDSLNKPNGIMLSKDEKTLYVGDADGNINQYRLDSSGALIEKGPLFANVPVPDGMALDCAGNLYVASHGEGAVMVFSDQGNLLQSINVAPQATNVGFGGEDNKTLLITTGKGLFKIHTQLAGMIRKNNRN